VLANMAPDLGVAPGGRVLDYGCAEGPYRKFFEESVEVVGADLAGNPGASVRLREDGRVPLANATFDAVLSTQVLEHAVDPALHLRECHRLLRPGGRLLVSTHGTMPYHPDPVDLWRWTSAGLREQLAGAGLEVVRFEGVMGLAATGVQLIQDGLYWRLPSWLRPALALVMQGLARALDRLDTRETRRVNAMVYAAVAERP